MTPTHSECRGCCACFDQVLLYLERKTAEPMTIFIKMAANKNNLITEIVEETATIEDIMGIMQSLEVVAAWAETADTIVRLRSAAYVAILLMLLMQ